MSDPDIEAQMRAVLSTEAFLVKIVRELGRDLGLIAIEAAGLEDNSRKLLMESIESIETTLARVGEFLPEPPRF